jgi:hypothetical protein
MDTVKQRPAVAANNHRWPAAAARELVTSGHITLFCVVSCRSHTGCLPLSWTHKDGPLRAERAPRRAAWCRRSRVATQCHASASDARLSMYYFCVEMHAALSAMGLPAVCCRCGLPDPPADCVHVVPSGDGAERCRGTDRTGKNEAESSMRKSLFSSFEDSKVPLTARDARSHFATVFFPTQSKEFVPKSQISFNYLPTCTPILSDLNALQL